MWASAYNGGKALEGGGAGSRMSPQIAGGGGEGFGWWGTSGLALCHMRINRTDPDPPRGDRTVYTASLRQVFLGRFYFILLANSIMANFIINHQITEVLLTQMLVSPFYVHRTLLGL